MSESSPEPYYGLPSEVRFCKRCVMSNQRPASAVEFKHTRDSRKQTLNIDDEGVCDACRNHEIKEQIDWQDREGKLLELLDRHRSKDGSYDCLVPGSGGKDSCFAAHKLKYEYGMHPLTVTWPPILYTSYGFENFRAWIDAGFDNVSFTRNGNVMKLLTRLAIENLFHPFQTFILGQKSIAAKLALRYGIDLVFYGENEAEYGNPIADNASSLRHASYHTYSNLDELFLGGVSLRELKEKHGVSLHDLMAFLPPAEKDLAASKIEIHYLGYYIKWVPQEVYYYAADFCGFKARPFRTQGTYSKYNSIDDKIDDLHYYTTFIKFGIGRATYDASQEVRNRHLTRDEAATLVQRFDGEFPDRYFAEIMEYLDMDPDHFHRLAEQFRSPHLWKKDEQGEWKLRHNVNGTGLDD